LQNEGTAFFLDRFLHLEYKFLTYTFLEGLILNISKLWGENSAFVLNICLRLVGDAKIAEDIRQDVFLKIINSEKPFDGKSSIKTWLYSITYRCCMDYFRDKNKQKKIVRECVCRDDFYTKDVEYPEWKANEISEMPCPISQLMVELYLGEGWSKQDLSNVFGFDMMQINKKLQRGFKNLLN
jgi:RNA polymerase sigma-70 factor (ECF subfamily)